MSQQINIRDYRTNKIPPGKLKSLFLATLAAGLVNFPPVGLAAAVGDNTVAERTITVKKGDTLTKIARQYLADPSRWPELLKYNDIPNPNLILPGRKLKIPGFLSREPVARVTSSQGDSRYRSASGREWEAVSARLQLFLRDQLRTFADARVDLDVPVGNDLEILPRSLVMIDQTLREKARKKKKMRPRIFLKRGRIYSRVLKNSPVDADGFRFRLRTPAAIAAVRGTEFLTEVNQKKTTRLTCTEGQVAVSAQGHSVEVKAGQYTTVKMGEKPAEPRELPPEAEIELD